MQKTYHTAAGPVLDTSKAPLLNRLLRRLLDADRRYREHCAMANLTSEQLDDVGLSREDVRSL